jgi:Protein of unknown function (DUF3467)
MDVPNSGRRYLVVPDLFTNDPVPEFYVDAARFGYSPYGFIFEFGVTQLADANNEPAPNKPLAVVRMSPQHAWVFVKTLEKQIAAFESANGKINLPESVKEQFGT